MKYEGGRAENILFLHICKIGQYHGFWTIRASFFSFYQNQKKWTINLELFPATFVSYFSLSMEQLKKKYTYKEFHKKNV